jgi:hypothetical protein
LAKQTQIKYGILDSGSTTAFFQVCSAYRLQTLFVQHSTVATYKRMWQYMSTQVPSVLVADYAEGIKRVRESKVCTIRVFIQ